MDLRKLGASGLECDLLVHPPWAVARVFDLTSDEAENPTQWIARHRSEVFPPGIEDDVIMSFSLRKRGGKQSNLIVGLTRRATLKPMSEAIARAGCIHRATIIGPLSALERIEPQPDDADVTATERTGVGSIGCWLFEHGELLGWTELSDGNRTDADLEGELLRKLKDLFDSEPTRIDAVRQIPIPTYEPHLDSASRWRIPRKYPTEQRGIIVSDRISGSNPLALRAWLAWSFRWCTAIAAVALVLAGLTACISAIALSLAGSDSDRISAVYERHRTLSADLRALEKKANTTGTSYSDSRVGRLWYDLGSEKPSGLWLRQMKTGPATSTGSSTTWLIEGLSRDKDAPRRYADNLASGGGYRTRLTRLERVDASKLKDIPVPLKSDLYRFAIEVQP
jgi:hypothetical protein